MKHNIFEVWEKPEMGPLPNKRKRRKRCPEFSDDESDSSEETKIKSQRTLNPPSGSAIAVLGKTANSEQQSASIPQTSKDENLLESNRKLTSSQQDITLSDVSQVYLTWENKSNLCWLHSALVLLVHNQTLKQEISKTGGSLLHNIITQYWEAMIILNDLETEKRIDIRIQKARENLQVIQESSLKYLQPIMKFQPGKPDSAFCCIYNLVSEEKNIKKLFQVDYAFLRQCWKCKESNVVHLQKPIITLSKIHISFPDIPECIGQCLSCKVNNKLLLKFETLAPCLIFHFEHGAGSGILSAIKIEICSRVYELTGLITLNSENNLNVNHFVTWIRDPAANSWMECDDLLTGTLSFSGVQPDIKLEDIYIMQFEATDTRGAISNVAAECYKDESFFNTAEIPLIDISEETSDSDTSPETYEKTALNFPKSGDSCSNEKNSHGKHCNEIGYPLQLKETVDVSQHNGNCINLSIDEQLVLKKSHSNRKECMKEYKSPTNESNLIPVDLFCKKCRPLPKSSASCSSEANDKCCNETNEHASHLKPMTAFCGKDFPLIKSRVSCSSESSIPEKCINEKGDPKPLKSEKNSNSPERSTNEQVPLDVLFSLLDKAQSDLAKILEKYNQLKTETMMLEQTLNMAFNLRQHLEK